MPKKLLLISVCAISLLSGCATFEGGFGYRSKLVEKDKHWLFFRTGDAVELPVVEKYWHVGAAKLCPNGYEAEELESDIEGEEGPQFSGLMYGGVPLFMPGMSHASYAVGYVKCK